MILLCEYDGFSMTYIGDGVISHITINNKKVSPLEFFNSDKYRDFIFKITDFDLCIRYINCPDLLKYIVRQHGSLIKLIFDKYGHISEELKLIAVTEDADTLNIIIDLYGYASEELKLIALCRKQNLNTVFFMVTFYNDLHEYLWLAAVIYNHDVLRVFPLELPEYIQLELVQKDGYLVKYLLETNDVSDDVKRAAIKQSKHAFDYLFEYSTLPSYT